MKNRARVFAPFPLTGQNVIRNNPYIIPQQVLRGQKTPPFISPCKTFQRTPCASFLFRRYNGKGTDEGSFPQTLLRYVLSFLKRKYERKQFGLTLSARPARLASQTSKSFRNLPVVQGGAFLPRRLY